MVAPRAIIRCRSCIRVNGDPCVECPRGEYLNMSMDPNMSKVDSQLPILVQHQYTWSLNQPRCLTARRSVNIIQLLLHQGRYRERTTLTAREISREHAVLSAFTVAFTELFTVQLAGVVAAVVGG